MPNPKNDHESAAIRGGIGWVLALTLAAAIGAAIWASGPGAQSPGKSAGKSARGEPLKAPGDSNAVASGTPMDFAPKAGVTTVGFDRLSAFQVRVSEALIRGQGDAAENTRTVDSLLPESVKALAGKRVMIAGFMLPTDLKDGKVTGFMLLKNQAACCYGVIPGLNDYVVVRMNGKGVEMVMDRVMNVTGTLHVGEVRQGGVLAGIYRLEADRVELVQPP